MLSEKPRTAGHGSALVVRRRKAPLLRLDRSTWAHSFELGATVVCGAALMVELVSSGKLVGYICASLEGNHDITEHQIARNLIL